MIEVVPPIDPDADENTLDDPAFSARCTDKFLEETFQLRCTVTTIRVTISPRWGRIWRADFITDSEKYIPYFVNRAIYWQLSDNDHMGIITAFGQKIRPLRELG